MFAVGVDIGGTFTDLACIDIESGQVTTSKHLSDHESPFAPVAEGLEAIRAGADAIDRIVHGTTIATNALLERRGATTAIVTTEGCRDVVEIGRGRRLVEGGMFDVRFQRPSPLVTRDRRLEIGERIRATGQVLKPLAVEDVKRAARTLAQLGVNSVAVCFLHSYRFDEHERRAAEVLRSELGEDVFISISSEIDPRFREFERFSTTVANAYVGPKVADYLRKLRSAHSEAGGRSVYLMGSSGGILDTATAETHPIRTVLSGPAGGVAAARLIGVELGVGNIITCDMGGTSTDVALIHAGRLFYAEGTIISGIPIRASQLDINTVGAGAGSIVSIDSDNALCVGPMSAGASPGPACYGIGGTQPTVTDANVVLGRIADGTVLGGRITIQAALARRSFAEILRAARVRQVEMAAEGALKLLVAKTARAVREISLERGFDPRDFTLLAFGGAGPMHAAEIAAELNIGKVIIPHNAGILSAVGLARADLRRDAVMTYLTAMTAVDWSDLRRSFDRLQQGLVAEMSATDSRSDGYRLSFAVSMRCIGQAHELLVQLSVPLEELNAERLEEAFRAIYAQRYGRLPEAATEIVQLSAIIECAAVAGHPAPLQAEAGCATAASPTERKVYLDGANTSVAVYDRSRLSPSSTFLSPCIVEEASATTVVPAGWRVEIHPLGHMVLTRLETPPRHNS